MRGVARVRVQKSGTWIEDGDEVGKQLKRGEPRMDRVGVEELVGQPVFGRTAERSRYDHSLRRADHQTTGDRQERSPSTLFQLAPELVGALDERDVQWMLEVLLANDPAVRV